MKNLLKSLLVVLLLLITVPVFASNNGKITITNAEEGKTYKIYEILKLESYNIEKNAFSYKSTDTWKPFVESETGKKYFVTDEHGYVTWKESADVQKLAVDAIKYAKDNNIKATATKTASKTGSLEFTGLELGYYLVDSTMGALCGLTTTKPEANIIEKNTPPTIEKQVKEDSTGNYGKNNTAQIGDVIEFKTTIYAKKGAQNYKLIDNMTAGLTLDQTSIIVTVGNTTLTPENHYDLITSPNEFTITFKNSYLDTITEDTTIVVTYKALLNENAVIGNAQGEYGNGNDNKVILEYGVNHRTNYEETRTFTYSFDIVKTDKENIQLEGAEFILLDENKNKIPVVKVNGENTYRVALEGETGVNIVVGHATIIGLDTGNYYLEEVKQPDGYNILADLVLVKIEGNNKPAITNQTDTTITYVSGGVQVINYTGTELPSTGGFGTFMFILMGSLTVIACGILLTAKLRMSKISA